MIRSAVTVSLVAEARGGPFVFWDDLPAACRKAQALGFNAVEIFPPSADAFEAANVRSLLNEYGLQLAAVGTGAGWVKHRLHLCLPDSAKREEARQFIRSIIDAAGAFGAPAIIGSMQGRSGDGVDHPTATAWLTESLNVLGDDAAKFQVPLLYEPLNRYETNMCNTVESGVRLLKSLSTKNVKLLADLFHMNIEETDLAAAIRGGAGHIGHVHFVDSNRRPAGFGHINYLPIVQALRDIDYTGYLSAEAFPHPDPDAAALQTIKKFKEVISH